MTKKLTWILLIVSLIYLIRFWLNNFDRFSKKFELEYFSKLYSESQYVLGSKSKGGIGDDGLYAFSGYYYFMQRGDVSAVNFEHPPLGKYLIGLSIFLFHNELIINLFYFFILLLVTYKLGKLFINHTYALIPPCLLMFDPLFLDHTIRSQLDLPFTLFFVAAVYFFIKSIDNYKYFLVSQFFWACAFSTRFFPMLIILEIYMIFIIFIKNKSGIIQFIISLVLIPVVYLLVHTSYFFYHPSFVEFLRHKKWMLSWFTGTPVKPWNILRNFYTGSLLDTSDNLVKNKEWSLIQPIIITLNLIPLELNIIFGFIVIRLLYCIFLTGGQAKFLMPVYPLMLIFAVESLNRLYSIISQWMKPKLRFLRAK